MAVETIALIRELAVANRLWGADRIRGELLKLDIRVSKRTIQRYLQQARPPGRSDQAWSAFLCNHAGAIWACDFLPIMDAFFRPVYAFFVIPFSSRRVVHVGVTRHPTDAWVAQPLREATPFGQHPQFRIHDRDATFSPACDAVFAAEGVMVRRTPFRAPNANTVAERWVRSARTACLDHFLIAGEGHLRRVLSEYVVCYNRTRPHHGGVQRCPVTFPVPIWDGPVRRRDRLGGLRHDDDREVG